MSSPPRFSLVVPFHRDIDRLPATLDQIERHGADHGIQEVLLCHNGEALDPGAAARLQACLRGRMRLLHTPRAGIGAGYRLGIAHASAPFVILSASDLPFGFTDVDAFLERHARSPLHFAIGSKAHPESRLIGWPWTRRLASIAFHGVRRLLLGRDAPADSQGTFIIETGLARELSALCQADDYFFTVELVTRHLRRRGVVVEVPVHLRAAEQASSSVSLLRDGWALLRQVAALWAAGRRRRRTPPIGDRPAAARRPSPP